MNYTIHTPSATRLKDEIIDRVSAGVDANGINIDTWKCVETEDGDKVLTYTIDGWDEKGCIAIKLNQSHNQILVRYCNWENILERENDNDEIMLSRFTELILVHFRYFIDKLVIE